MGGYRPRSPPAPPSLRNDYTCIPSPVPYSGINDYFNPELNPSPMLEMNSTAYTSLK